MSVELEWGGLFCCYSHVTGGFLVTFSNCSQYYDEVRDGFSKFEFIRMTSCCEESERSGWHSLDAHCKAHVLSLLNPKVRAYHLTHNAHNLCSTSARQ
eukprot:434989-Pelagomonas_calceolata.AAC.2